MTQFRISEAAALLGVSDDTVRRWSEQGRLTTTRGSNGMQVVEGTELLPVMAELAAGGALAEAFPVARASARNRFPRVRFRRSTISSTCSGPRRRSTRCAATTRTVSSPA